MSDHVCSKCGKGEPEVSFGSNKSRPNGLSAWCKECKRGADQTREEKIKKDLRKIRGTAEKLITIDFSAHSELYESIMQKAVEELRTPGNQLLYAMTRK